MRPLVGASTSFARGPSTRRKSRPIGEPLAAPATAADTGAGSERAGAASRTNATKSASASVSRRDAAIRRSQGAARGSIDQDFGSASGIRFVFRHVGRVDRGLDVARPDAVRADDVVLVGAVA